MEILLKYTEKVPVDKRLLKKGIPISTILDNVEMRISLVKKANLGINEMVQQRILDKLINNSNGNLIRDAYKKLKKVVKEQDENSGSADLEQDAAKWLICISEKYNTSEIFKDKRINKTRLLYKDMKFNEEGHMKGVNPNAYIIPQIVRIANLNISKEAEADIINNMFFIKRIKYGQRVDKIYKDLAERVREDNPSCDEEHIMQDAARWIVFLSENSQIPFEAMFDNKRKNRYIDITKDCYKQMSFDDKGNYINHEIDELKGLEKEFITGVDFMKIVNTFFRAKGDCYLIEDRLVKKDELQEIMRKELSKCKNKKSTRATCIKIIRELCKKNREESERGKEER